MSRSCRKRASVTMPSACKDDPGWQPTARWPGWWVQCPATRMVVSSRSFVQQQYAIRRSSAIRDTGELMVWISRSSFCKAITTSQLQPATVQAFQNPLDLLSHNHCTFECVGCWSVSYHVIPGTPLGSAFRHCIATPPRAGGLLPTNERIPTTEAPA